MSAASAGAGSSSAESALSAAAAALVPLGSVFVKRSGDARAHLAKVDIFAGDDVADLAKNASKARGWGVDAAYVEGRQVARAVGIAALPAPTGLVCLPNGEVAVSHGTESSRIIRFSPRVGGPKEPPR